MNTNAAVETRSLTPTLAESFGQFCSSISDTASADALEQIKPYVIDTLAVMIAGSSTESSAVMRRAISSMGATGPATVAALGSTASACDAAMLNGGFAHALELDDDHRVAVLHPGAVVVPAALAACELAQTSGREFLAAVLAGYEVMCRLGLAYQGSHFDHSLHPTAIFGVFGAAAATCVGLGLDAKVTAQAFGIAGTQAAGLTEWRADGSWIKRLHPGKAAHSGVLSGLLAREGYTGPTTIFEGQDGFFRALGHGKSVDIETVRAQLGEKFHALDTAIKPYPCCRFMHGALDLALEAYNDGLRPENISRVDVQIYETGVLSYHQVPINSVDAQFNIPYGVACALVQGTVSLPDYEPQSVTRAEILEMSHRIFASPHAPYTAAYPEIYNVTLTITQQDGTVLRLHSTCPLGDPEAQPYQVDPARLGREVEQKAISLLDETGFSGMGVSLTRAVKALDGTAGLDELLDCVRADSKG